MTYPAPSINKGFALPAAIFLVVIVGLIISGLERINNNQIATSTMGLQSSRAYAAAYSGMEWAAYRVKSTTACPATGVIAGLDLEGFQVAVKSCSFSSYVEGAVTVNTFDIRVLATYGGEAQYGVSPDFASRELSVSMVIEN